MVMPVLGPDPDNGTFWMFVVVVLFFVIVFGVIAMVNYSVLQVEHPIVQPIKTLTT
jgi:hypothetical protein